MSSLLTSAASTVEFPQSVQGVLNVEGERDGIERVKLSVQRLALLNGEYPSDDEALIRRAGDVLALEDS